MSVKKTKPKSKIVENISWIKNLVVLNYKFNKKKQLLPLWNLVKQNNFETETKNY